MFCENSVDLVYASHVLEHLSIPEGNRAMAEWRRVLKHDGMLRLAVPDFSVIVKMYTEQVGLDIVMGPLMGAQHYELNHHKSVFDEPYLGKLLSESGFQNIERWDPATTSWHEFDDASSKVYEIGGRRYAISLNLQGTKQ